MSQCTAHRKNGDACRAQAVSGTNVCRVHGGNAPQVRRRAAQRLLEASDSAAAYLVRVVNDETKPDGVRLAAARDLLDRAGLGAKERIEVEIGAVKDKGSEWMNILPEIIFDMAPATATASDVIDAEVVPATPTELVATPTIAPADSDAARAAYIASRDAADPMPPGAVQRVDGPRPRIRRRP